MDLLSKYLPRYHFFEKHGIVINASRQVCYKAAMELDISRSKTISFLFRMRGLPAKAQQLSSFTQKMNFTLLEENPPQEFLYGFWIINGISPIVDRIAFIENDSICTQKVVWDFYFEMLTPSSTRVTTITRVKSITRSAKIKFGIYWLFIKPFSGIIRVIMLKLLKKEAERKMTTHLPPA